MQAIERQEELKEVFASVAEYFSMLSEPTRLRLLHAICHEEKSVNEIVESTGISQTNASRHLNLMYQAGVLSRRKEGNLVYYQVADQVFIELCRTVCLHVAGQMDSPTLLRKGLESYLEETAAFDSDEGKDID